MVAHNPYGVVVGVVWKVFNFTIVKLNNFFSYILVL